MVTVTAVDIMAAPQLRDVTMRHVETKTPFKIPSWRYARIAAIGCAHSTRLRSFATHILSLWFPDQISATSSPAMRAENHVEYFSAIFALLLCYTA